MRQITLIGLSMLCATVAIAQTRQITGIIVDDAGEALAGATIKVVGTNKGVLTDMNGKFTIAVDPSTQLQISYVGYQTELVKVGGQKTLKVVLHEESNMVDEIVVVGYGSGQVRTKVTNSIAKVKQETLGVGIFSNPAQALSGAVSGLKVIQSSGSPGAAPKIVLRGGTNFDGSGDPLVVVDGQIRNGLNDINPEDIENMEVLKDAGATAIYGARASNGVLLITTKSGKIGRSEINLKIKTGLDFYTPIYDMLGAEDYIRYMRLAYDRSGYDLNDGTHAYRAPMQALNKNFPFGLGNEYGKTTWNILKKKSDTEATAAEKELYSKLLNSGWSTMKDPLNDQIDILYKDTDLTSYNIHSPALSQDYNLSMQGGSDKGTYYAGIGYNHKKGFPISSYYKRYSFLLNGSYQLRPWVKSVSSFSYNRANWLDMPGSQTSIANYFGRIQSIPPTVRYEDEDGNQLLGPGVGDGNQNYQADKFRRDNQTDKFTLTQAFEIKPIKDLTIKLSGIYYYSEGYYESFNRDFLTNQIQNVWDRTRSSSAKYDRSFSQTYNAVADYKINIAEHHFAPMLGMEYLSTVSRGFSASGSGAPTDDFSDLALTNSDKDKRSIDSWHSEYRILSYFGRLNYDYKDKYLLSVTFRQDGYSSLISNRWGLFPGVSGGWLFGQEDFVKKALPFLSYGKLRVSYGINGNATGIGPYELQGIYGTSKYNGNVGFYISSLPNFNLRWEKTTTKEIGLDLGFLKNRLTTNLTFYHRLTDDKYADLKLPNSTGFTNTRTNNGQFRNMGIEFDVNARILEGKDWKWSASGNIAYGISHITKLPYNGIPGNRIGGVEVYTGEGKRTDANGKSYYPTQFVNSYQEGAEPGKLVGYIAEGIYRSMDEIPGDLVMTVGNGNGKKLYGPNAWKKLTIDEQKNALPIVPGDVRWKDINGDGVIDEFDQAVIGNTTPRWFGGFNTTLSYKNWSLYLRTDFALGFWLRETRTPWLLGAMQGTYNTIQEVKDTWSPENPNGSLPRYVWADQLGNGNYNLSSNLFAYRGDYLVFREISLTYALPEAWAKKVFCQKISLSITGQNLGYLTAAKHVATPEQGGNVDAGYSLPRTLLFGLNVTF